MSPFSSMKEQAAAVRAKFNHVVEHAIAKHMLWAPTLEHHGAFRTDVVLNDGRAITVRIDFEQVDDDTVNAKIVREWRR
jgi:hypothetical protein